MTEQEFESRLEFRICGEFSGMSDKQLRAFWCDGLSLEVFILDDANPRALGHAWICKGQSQEKWHLELFLPKGVRSREEMDWESLLPPEDVTQWLTLDRTRKLVQIDPMAAVSEPD